MSVVSLVRPAVRVPRWATGALALLALVLAVLTAAQLALPRIAAQRLRAELAGNGQVLAVRVSAFPAIELLWHHADSVVVHLGAYRAMPAAVAERLGQTAAVDSLRVSARTISTGLVTLRDVTLVKRGARLTAAAVVTEGDLRAALPILTSVTPVASGGGQLVFRGTASLFGVSATVDAVLSAEAGRLVVAPDVPFGDLAAVTVFSDPRVSVDSVSASPAGGGFTVSGTATVW